MKYYTVAELAEQLQVHPTTIKREVSRNNLGHFKVGTEIRFTQEHVDQYTNVMQFGKTKREIELEKKVQALESALEEKNNFIHLIKDEVLKIAQV